jgi:hypothetical protein
MGRAFPAPLAHHARCGEDGRVAYDEDLANRIRELLADEPGVVERPMFGGLAFLVGGHMGVAASRDGGLMVRCAPEETDALLARPHAGPMVMRGHELDGWLRVRPEGLATRRGLRPWVERGIAYARSLPPQGG